MFKKILPPNDLTKIQLDTPNKLEYTFYPNNNGYVKFQVRAPNNAHIALSTASTACNPMYEIIIGGWRNTKTVIRKNRIKPEKAEVLTPNILDAYAFRTFWISWDLNRISAGYDDSPQPFISWTDDEYVPICYIGVCTGWDASGSWIIEQGGAPLEGFGGGKGGYKSLSGDVSNNNWVSSSGGNIPPEACVGGSDVRSLLYVIRCNYRGGLIPGKLHVGYKTAYIPWNGVEIEFNHYEVLCGCNGSWIPCLEGKIPPNAVVGGHSNDGELLYIGRACHLGAVTIGRVQRSHGCCLIPYGGREYRYQRYEILVS